MLFVENGQIVSLLIHESMPDKPCPYCQHDLELIDDHGTLHWEWLCGYRAGVGKEPVTMSQETQFSQPTKSPGKPVVPASPGKPEYPHPWH